MPNDVIPVVPTPSAMPTTFSQEYVSELRHESATYRTGKKEAEAKAQAAEELAKKAVDDANTKVSDAKKIADERIIRAELKASAIKAGMVDLDGLKLADLSVVKLNDAGEVEGADALMESLKKSKSYLFGSTTHTTIPGSSSPKPADNKFKPASEMTTEEYRKQREAIRRGEVPKMAA